MAESILIVPTRRADWDRWDAEAEALGLPLVDVLRDEVRRIAGQHYAGRVALLVEDGANDA